MTPVMNKPANIELNVQLLSVILFFVLSVNFNAFAQHTFTTIKKNLNPDAVNLEHDLTVNGDSLVLNSDYLFDKIANILTDNKVKQNKKLKIFDPAGQKYSILKNENSLKQDSLDFPLHFLYKCKGKSSKTKECKGKCKGISTKTK